MQEDEGAGLLRKWTQTLVLETGRLPITFYLTAGSTAYALSPESADEVVYSLGGPLILVEENHYEQSRVLKKEFPSEELFRLSPNSNAVVVREPQAKWMDQFEENLAHIKKRPGRHPLEYDPRIEMGLPPQLKEERKQLDNLVNLPGPKERSKLESNRVTIRVMNNEEIDDVSKRAYQDVPIGRKGKKGKSVGGRSLLIACNKDANLINGWSPGDESFQVHNASSMHFTASVRPGTLPEAMNSGRVVLKNAWIQGNYDPPEVPKRQPKRMIWPKHNLPGLKDSE